MNGHDFNTESCRTQPTLQHILALISWQVSRVLTFDLAGDLLAPQLSPRGRTDQGVRETSTLRRWAAAASGSVEVWVQSLLLSCPLRRQAGQCRQPPGSQTQWKAFPQPLASSLQDVGADLTRVWPFLGGLYSKARQGARSRRGLGVACQGSSVYVHYIVGSLTIRLDKRVSGFSASGSF